MYKNIKSALKLIVKELLVLMWKNKLGILTTILILIFVSLSIYSSAFREHFLFDKYGKFQWIGVSAIAAGTGIYLNAMLKREEVRANILTRNDLEILNDFRDNVSRISALIWKYNNVLHDLLQNLKSNNVLKKMGSFPDKNNSQKEQEYYDSIAKELNDTYLQIMELESKIYLNLSISFNQSAENVDNSLRKIIKLLDEAINMVETKDSYEHINQKYKAIIEENKTLILCARSYIVLVMENKVSSFDSKILKDK
mgnify:CR=1 FL=1